MSRVNFFPTDRPTVEIWLEILIAFFYRVVLISTPLPSSSPPPSPRARELFLKQKLLFGRGFAVRREARFKNLQDHRAFSRRERSRSLRVTEDCDSVRTITNALEAGRYSTSFKDVNGTYRPESSGRIFHPRARLAPSLPR